MSTRLALLSAAVVLPALLLSKLPAQEEGTAERVGRKIDQGLEQLTNKVQEAWTDVRKKVDQLSVQGRVYGRLRWDKAFADAPLDVDIQDDATVILTGRVPSEKAQRRAVRLAENTVGVHNVIDRLRIEPRP